MLLRWTTLAVFALVPGLLLAAEPDTDRDGIDDAQEDILGTDPRSPERLQAILDDGPESAAARAREGYDGSKDFTRVEFCHVGGDRYLWRVTLRRAAPAGRHRAAPVRGRGQRRGHGAQVSGQRHRRDRLHAERGRRPREFQRLFGRRPANAGPRRAASGQRQRGAALGRRAAGPRCGRRPLRPVRALPHDDDRRHAVAADERFQCEGHRRQGPAVGSAETGAARGLPGEPRGLGHVRRGSAARHAGGPGCDRRAARQAPDRGLRGRSADHPPLAAPETHGRQGCRLDDRPAGGQVSRRLPDVRRQQPGAAGLLRRRRSSAAWPSRARTTTAPGSTGSPSRRSSAAASASNSARWAGRASSASPIWCSCPRPRRSARSGPPWKMSRWSPPSAGRAWSSFPGPRPGPAPRGWSTV